MKLIGRKKELQKLNDSIQSKESELIAVYGRRRVGKTFLIRSVYKDKMVFQLTGLDKGSERQQLRNFHDVLKRTTDTYQNRRQPADWPEAFLELIQYLDTLTGKEKKVLFIDELPWICSRRSDFLTQFGHFWNTYCSERDDLIVVVCGSAASFMVKEIVRSTGGLHNRISYSIPLMPFNLHETEQYLNEKQIPFTRYDTLKLYMTIGGVPYYLKKIKKNESLVQNIDRLCFEKGGELIQEFDDVFVSLFSSSTKHKKIVEALAETRKEIPRDELIIKTGLPNNGHFSTALGELITSGFVSENATYKKKKNMKQYRLSDEYSRFYLKYIEPNKDQGSGTWSRLSNQQSYISWAGFSFETTCLKHAEQIKKALQLIKGTATHSAWYNENAQVDLVIDRNDGRTNLCEMKFYNTEYTVTAKYEADLRNKMTEFTTDTGTKNSVVTTMITTFGLKTNKYSNSVVTDSFDMNILFEDE
jgi:AAA+ ATPase superfamily predicted ATPase